MKKTFCKQDKEIDLHLERGDCALILRKNGDRQLFFTGSKKPVPAFGSEIQLAALCVALEDPELMALIFKNMNEMTTN